MTKLRGLILAGLAVALAGCSGIGQHSEIQALNEAQPSGSPFTQYLSAEYRDYANRENKENFDYPDAIHFARKGLAAANGDVVMPEPLSDWNLLPKHMEELGTARGRLINAFGAGARDVSPQLAAIAQARFDCWIEQQEENWQKEDIAGCKSQFMEAMDKLEAAAKIPAAMPPADDMGPVSALDGANGTMKAEDAMYLVFFDFNKSDITAGAESVLDAVAAEVKKRGQTSITVVGHTDTSGSDGYNEKLAVRRATSVKDALARRGISVEQIATEGRGEHELLVKTGDNTREPANRRAQITFK